MSRLALVLLVLALSSLGCNKSGGPTATQTSTPASTPSTAPTPPPPNPG